MAEPAPRRRMTVAEFLAYDDRRLAGSCPAYVGGGVWLAETDDT